MAIEALVPVLLSAYGRTGTTALMGWLATDEHIAVDKTYPFENRYITYLAKLSLLSDRSDGSSVFDALHLTAYNDDRFGAPPWDTKSTPIGPLMPAPNEWFGSLWQMFSASVRHRFREVTRYAE